MQQIAEQGGRENLKAAIVRLQGSLSCPLYLEPLWLKPSAQVASRHLTLGLSSDRPAASEEDACMSLDRRSLNRVARGVLDFAAASRLCGGPWCVGRGPGNGGHREGYLSLGGLGRAFGGWLDGSLGPK